MKNNQIMNFNWFSKAFDLEDDRIGALDGLRAIAIIMVFNVHYFGFYAANNFFSSEDSWWPKIINVLRSGHLGVDLFFIISGYLIYRSIRGRQPNISFIKNRFIRLFPAHLFVCIYIAKGVQALSIKSFLTNILFLAPVVTGTVILNEVTWSLTWEWFFYIFIFIAVTIKPHSDRAVVLIVLLLMTLVPVAATQIFSVPAPFYPGRFGSFIFGIILVWLQSQPSFMKKTKFFGLYGVFGFAAILILQILWSKYSREIQELPLQGGFYLASALFFSVIIKSGMTHGSWINRLFSTVPLRFIGKISYSFYIVHSIIIGEVLNRIPAASSVYGIFYRYLLVVFITIIVSSAMYYLLERPYFAWRRNRAIAESKSLIGNKNTQPSEA